eukprot:9470489-Pyramimonas_sp.AAC.1
MRQAALEPNVISYSSGIRVEGDAAARRCSHIPEISARGKVGQRAQALSLLSERGQSSSQTSAATALGQHSAQPEWRLE